MTFKLQHPQDLVSRLFILEYMRAIGANALYAKANEHQKKDLFYNYTGETPEEIFVDVNWEACLFEATIPQLDHFMKNFLEEIELIDVAMQEDFARQKEAKEKELQKEPVDVNIMDLAKKAIENNKNGKLRVDGDNQL